MRSILVAVCLSVVVGATGSPCSVDTELGRHPQPEVELEFWVVDLLDTIPSASSVWSWMENKPGVSIVLKGVSDSDKVHTKIEILVRRNPFDLLPEELPDSMQGSADDRWLLWSDDGGRDARFLHRIGVGRRLAFLDVVALSDGLNGALHPNDSVELIRVSVRVGESEEFITAALELLWPL